MRKGASREGQSGYAEMLGRDTPDAQLQMISLRNWRYCEEERVVLGDGLGLEYYALIFEGRDVEKVCLLTEVIRYKSHGASCQRRNASAGFTGFTELTLCAGGALY